MNSRILLKIALLLIVIISCNQSKSKLEAKIINGVYHSDDNSSKRKVIRGWGGPSWQFIVTGKKSVISYIDSRGIGSYNLSVNLSINENIVQAKFDSIISSSQLADSKMKEFNYGDLLFEYHLSGDSIISNSEFFQSHSSKNKSISFYQVIDSNKINTKIIEPKDYSGFRSVKEYLGRGRSKKVLVVPCYNGYNYIQMGYDFNPIIEKKLKENKEISIIPIPYKKMNGSGYQSIYDKKYCAKILEKTNVDFLIMTKFTGNLIDLNEKTKTLGYETKILNVKTMEQNVSIRAVNLESYEAIEKHIEKNIEKLISDFI